MAKKRVIKSNAGVVLTEQILFGGQPRTRVGTQYTVSTPRRPEGKTFDNVEEAAKFFHVQISLSGRRTVRPVDGGGQGLGQVTKNA